MRESVRWFSQEMEIVLRNNDYKKGINGWNECSPLELSQGLEKNLHELKALLVTNDDPAEIIRTTVDIANYSMMLADKSRQR